MRCAALVGTVLLATVSFAGAGDAVDVYANCRDGQAPGGDSTRCDTDGRADGNCTFEGRAGETVVVGAGQSIRHVHSSGVVGQHACEPAGSGETAEKPKTASPAYRPRSWKPAGTPPKFVYPP